MISTLLSQLRHGRTVIPPPASPTAPTTTRSSGHARCGRRTSTGWCGRRASTSSPWRSSPGPASSPRTSGTSAGSTRSSNLLHAGASGSTWPPPPPPRRPGSARRTPEILPVTACRRDAVARGASALASTSPSPRVRAAPGAQIAKRSEPSRTGRPGTSPTAGLPQRLASPTTPARAFRDWLRARYTTLDALNHAWGTAFWSQRYSDWEQMLPPAARPPPNPTARLRLQAFSSDVLKELCARSGTCCASSRPVFRSPPTSW